MARKTDNHEARQRKQKIILAVGGVLLVGLAAIQGPKIWKQMNPPAAEPVASAAQPDGSTAGSTAATSTAGALSSPTTAASAPVRLRKAPKSATTQLAGVLIVPEQPVMAGEGQLDSFSRFESKDLFVQQVNPQALPTPAEVAGTSLTPTVAKPTPAPTPTAAPKPTSPTGGTAGAPASGVVNVGKDTPLVAPAATMAMLRVNGKLQVVALKKRFPASDKAFVLRSLTTGSATIAVADGSFAGGTATLTLKLGRPVTLVNTATGVRYVLRLVYVGADAAQVTGFSASK